MKRLIALFCIAACAAAPLAAQAVVPPTPTNLKAELLPSFIPAVVQLTWQIPAPGPWGFIVYRSSGDTVHFSPVAKVNTLLYIDNLHYPTGSIYYCVTSFDVNSSGAVVESPRSIPVKVEFGTAPSTGKIAGRVIDDLTQDPIPAVAIRMFRKGIAITLWPPPMAYTDTLGRYAAVVDTGEYYLRADPPPLMNPIGPTYLAEWFDNVQDMTKATAVHIVNSVPARADFGLARLEPPVRPRGIIQGVVTDDTSGRPIPRVIITFYGRTTATVRLLPTAVTDATGFYTAELDTGTYFVHAGTVTSTATNAGYLPEWFDNAREVAHATPVPVTPGSQFKASFGLSPVIPPPRATIAGRVTDTLGTPLRGADITIMRSLQMTALDPGPSLEVASIGYCAGVLWHGSTDSLGTYTATIPAGIACIALASKWGYLPEYFKEQRNPLQADVFTAPAAAVNFTLSVNPALVNSISGIVKDSLGQGVPSRVVLIPATPWTAVLPSLRFAHNDSLGQFVIDQVRAGRYVVLAIPFRGYGPAFYKAGAFGVIRWQTADVVAVSGAVAGIQIGVVPLFTKGYTRFAGTVTAPGNVPLEGVRVCVTDRQGDLVGFGVSDVTGAYAINGIPMGQLAVSFDREGYEGGVISVAVGQTTFVQDNLNQVLTPATPTGTDPGAEVPVAFGLEQNYPNPFNPETRIEYTVGGIRLQGSGVSMVRLTVYDVLGREVAVLVNEGKPAGTYSVQFDARHLASGVYVYRLTAGSFMRSRKMMLIR